MRRSRGLCLPFRCSLPTHTTLRRAIAAVDQEGLCSSSSVVRWGRARVCRPGEHTHDLELGAIYLSWTDWPALCKSDAVMVGLVAVSSEQVMF